MNQRGKSREGCESFQLPKMDKLRRKSIRTCKANEGQWEEGEMEKRERRTWITTKNKGKLNKLRRWPVEGAGERSRGLGVEAFAGKWVPADFRL